MFCCVGWVMDLHDLVPGWLHMINWCYLHLCVCWMTRGISGYMVDITLPYMLCELNYNFLVCHGVQVKGYFDKQVFVYKNKINLGISVQYLSHQLVCHGVVERYCTTCISKIKINLGVLAFVTSL